MKKRMEELTHEFEKKMNVAEVRKCLTMVRRMWEEHTPDSPICLSDQMPNGMLVSEFCFYFVMGHHAKRHNKSRKSNESG